MRFIFLLFLCSPLSLLAQFVSEQEFVFPLSVSITDMVEDEYGNFYFTAFHNASNFDSSMSVLIKADPNLDILWAKRYKIFRRDDMNTLTLLQDGNLLLGGTARQDFTLIKGASLFKVDTSGAVIWHKVYDGVNDDRVMRILEQPDSTLTVFVRYGVSNRATRILRLNKNGNIITQRNYSNGTIGVFGETVTQVGDSTYFMSGDVLDQSDGIRNLFIVALNNNSLLWYKEFSFPQAAEAFAITPTTDGHIALTGYILSDSLLNIWDGLIMKFNAMGEVIWAKRYIQPEPYNNYFSDIRPLSDGQLLLAGTNRSFITTDAVVMQIDSSGNPLWTRSFKPSDQQFFVQAGIRADSQLVLVANRLSGSPYLTITSSTGVGSCSDSSITMNVKDLVFTDSTMTPDEGDPGLLEEAPPLTVSDLSGNTQDICSGNVSLNDRLPPLALHVTPNPARDKVYLISSEELIHPQLSLVDLNGKAIQIVVVQEGNSVSVQLPDLPPGMYVLNVQDHHHRWAGKILVQP